MKTGRSGFYKINIVYCLSKHFEVFERDALSSENEEVSSHKRNVKFI
jgi:hypothetical protein